MVPTAHLLAFTITAAVIIAIGARLAFTGRRD